MEEEILGKYQKAGRITADIRKELKKMVRPGMKIIEVANYVDKAIEEKGGKPAFPVNISINDVTAHYTPSPNDTQKIAEGDLVKIDIGVHVDGYIGDMAFTYCSEDNELVKGAENAVNAAIGVIKPGVSVKEIGSAIEKTVHDLGLGLIVNLTGHTLDKFVFHGHPSIPNVKNSIDYELKEGEVVAIEPFVAPNNGFVKESKNVVEIYRYVQDRPVRMAEARKILELGRNEFSSLPFAKRWIRDVSPVKLSMALKQLEAARALESYPVLKETSGMKVSQAEHTIVVLDEPVVTTK